MLNLAERLLARVTDPTRAAAIMGDLQEMEPTRGRLWFWTAYARTLVSLAWRTPVAFLFAIASMRLMFRTVFPWLAHQTTHHWNNPGLFGEENRHVSMVLWNISLVIAQCLCFVLPYVALRFGLRNRLTQLACALFLLAAPVYSFSAWVRDLSGVLIVLAIVAAIGVAPWRRPLLVLGRNRRHGHRRQGRQCLWPGVRLPPELFQAFLCHTVSLRCHRLRNCSLSLPVSASLAA